MKLRLLSLASALAFSLTAATASEQSGTEMLFDTGALDGVQVGTTLTYSHDRSSDENIPSQPIIEGKAYVSVIKVDGKRRTEAALFDDQRKRRSERFSADRGNPVFVTFLESSVTSIAFATKGSPFYIRNRIKDAFGKGGKTSDTTATVDGKEVEATLIEYAPFKGDRNADKLGAAFENLSIRFVLADAAPGRFVSLTTDAAVAEKSYFREAVIFQSAGKAGE